MKKLSGNSGYTLLILLFAISVMSIGFLVAVPVWETQIQREKEEELIFRGKQYVEAVRIFQLRKPGNFSRSLEELLKEKCIRRLYKDPLTPHGEWNLILPYQRISSRDRQQPQASFQKIMVVPEKALPSIENPQILGVVSSSRKKSIKLYHDQNFYDRWLFFYGYDPDRMPEIVYYGQEERD